MQQANIPQRWQDELSMSSPKFWIILIAFCFIVFDFKLLQVVDAPNGMPSISASSVLRAIQSVGKAFGMVINEKKKKQALAVSEVRIVHTSPHHSDNRRVRLTESTILDDTFRNYEDWMEPVIRGKKEDEEEFGKKFPIVRSMESYIKGLYIGVYQQSPPEGIWRTFMRRMNTVSKFIATIQLGAAIQECIRSGYIDLLVWIITGMLLTIISGFLGFWRTQETEVWRLTEENKEKEFAIAPERIPHYALLVLGVKGGWDLDRMAGVGINVDARYQNLDKIITPILALCWIALVYALIFFVRPSYIKYIIPSLGIIPNLYAISTHHSFPQNVGMPLKFLEVQGGRDWMKALVQLEIRWPKAGKSLLEAYRHAGMSPGLIGDEVELWKKLQECEEDDVEIRVPKIMEIEKWMDRVGLFSVTWTGYLNLGLHLP